MLVLRHVFTENTQSHPPPSTSHQNSSWHTSHLFHLSDLKLQFVSTQCWLYDRFLYCEDQRRKSRSPLSTAKTTIKLSAHGVWSGWRGDMRWICGLSTICSHIMAHNQLKSMPALSVCRVVFIVRKEVWLFFGLILPSCCQGLNYSPSFDTNLKSLTVFFPVTCGRFRLLVRRGKSSFISWLKECSQLSMTSVIWHQRPEIDCLVVPLSPVCVEVFFGGEVRVGGGRKAEERGWETREREKAALWI